MIEKEQTLEERMLGYRSSTDYRLEKNLPVLIMVDGRSFSRQVKNRFKLPFDQEFINIMNKTAEYVSKNIQGCKFAYTQSDEISFYVDCSKREEETPFFEYRLSKILSIVSSMTTSMFNYLMSNEFPEPLYQFDCKAWNVPTQNDVFAWFLYRQIDCIRNSKQQAAQTYISHKDLMGKNTDLQIKLLLEREGIDWNLYNPGEKYGRFIWKEEEKYYNEKLGVEYLRSVWKAHNGWELTSLEGKEKLWNQLFKEENKKES